MNVAAFVLALLGALLSLFQPIITIPIMNVSINLLSLLSYPGADWGDKIFVLFVVIIAVVAVTCGVNALRRNDSEACAGGLALCGIIWVVLFLWSLLFSPMTHWVYLLWALCYFIAAGCAGNDTPPQTNESRKPDTPNSESDSSQKTQQQ